MGIHGLWETLLKLLLHVVFVFDGLKHLPDKGRKCMLELFGFHWTEAPSEAEAELAAMNVHSIIDTMMTEDSNILIFGATPSPGQLSAMYMLVPKLILQHMAPEVAEWGEILDLQNMTRLKRDSAEAKQPSDSIHKKAGQKRSAGEKMALADVQRCKKHSIKTHLQASNTRTNYTGHVHHGWEWLASHFGLVISRVPVAHPDGTSSPKNKSWKEIVERWLVGNWD
ncbi:hypothetical protein F4604DRAFT_1673413 [Suillus subluteus]|nr:hypothetical protein F4604DRAFT_1673413 [Suillus subluteus]